MERNERPFQFSALSTIQFAHDLQNLLAVISKCADSLAARGAGMGAGDRDLLELNDAVDAAFRLSRLLMASVGLVHAPEPLVIDVHDLIESYRGVLQRMLGQNFHLDARLGATAHLIEAMPVQLEWILLNLVMNARDAMPEGGVIRLETASIDPPASPADMPPLGPFLQLIVRDNGHGIAEDVMTAAFEPFFTTKEGRMGLGLTGVGITVRALRGWLYVQSQAGTGTAVHVLLPAFAGQGPTRT